jgi:hypothetical protein
MNSHGCKSEERGERDRERRGGEREGEEQRDRDRVKVAGLM